MGYTATNGYSGECVLYSDCTTEDATAYGVFEMNPPCEYAQATTAPTKTTYSYDSATTSKASMASYA